MCLYVKSVNDFKKAAEDIPCWKVLEYGFPPEYAMDIEEDDELKRNPGWFTPFVYYPISSDIITPREDTVEWNRDWSSIERGIIHCFNNFEDAQDTAGAWPNCYVLEAIIPKGTEYIEGSDTSRWGYINNYGSKCVKIIDPIFLDSISTGEPPKL